MEEENPRIMLGDEMSESIYGQQEGESVIS